MRRTRSTIITVAGLALVAAALLTGVMGGPILLAAGLASVALLVFALAPAILGRAARRAEGSEQIDPAALKRWRRDHPGSTISDAVDAHR